MGNGKIRSSSIPWVPIHVILWARDGPTVPQLSEQLAFRSGNLGAATGCAFPPAHRGRALNSAQTQFNHDERAQDGPSLQKSSRASQEQ